MLSPPNPDSNFYALESSAWIALHPGSALGRNLVTRSSFRRPLKNQIKGLGFKVQALGFLGVYGAGFNWGFRYMQGLAFWEFMECLASTEWRANPSCRMGLGSYTLKTKQQSTLQRLCVFQIPVAALACPRLLENLDAETVSLRWIIA